MARRRPEPLATAARRRGQVRSTPGAVLRKLRDGDCVAIDAEAGPDAGLSDDTLARFFCPASDTLSRADSLGVPQELLTLRPLQMLIDDERRGLKQHITSAIERDIIPRLMMTYVMYDEQHGAEPAEDAHLHGVRRPPVLDFERLAMQAVLEDVETLRGRLDELVEGGLPLTEVFLGLMAPAARHLGHLWTLDAIDFSSVTIGLTRLQQLVHSYGAAFTTPVRDSRGPARRALLVPAPGEQHTFGLIMVGEFMRRDGWETTMLLKFGCDELLSTIRDEPYDIVGLSLGNEGHFDEVRSLLRQVRRTSSSRSLGLMVGGNAINGEMEKVHYLGADATAADGRHVAAEAAKLVDLRTNYC